MGGGFTHRLAMREDWRGLMEALETQDGPLANLVKTIDRVKVQQMEDLGRRKAELQGRLEILNSEINQIDEKLKGLRGDDD